jgi:hypothetical protein
MLHGSRLNKDKLTEESVAKTMREAVIEYMAAVDQDKEDGLDPDTARLWKEQVQEIVTLANLDMPVAGTGGGEPELAPLDEAAGCLAPLKDAIDQARYTADAVTRELTDPEETVLRGFGKQLGSSKKEIMAMSKKLAVGQPASVSTEATRLASEACDAIKMSRESIRAALREMGPASDISEASGPVREAGNGKAGTGREEAGGPHVVPAAPPLSGLDNRASARRGRVAATSSPHQGNRRERGDHLATTTHSRSLGVASGGDPAEAQDRGGGRGVVGPHERHDECPSE